MRIGILLERRSAAFFTHHKHLQGRFQRIPRLFCKSWQPAFPRDTL